MVKQVVRDLMRNAPKRMISHEILAGAAGPGDWCARQQAHARAAAVMSMVSWARCRTCQLLDLYIIVTRAQQALTLAMDSWLDHIVCMRLCTAQKNGIICASEQYQTLHSWLRNVAGSNRKHNRGLSSHNEFSTM